MHTRSFCDHDISGASRLHVTNLPILTIILYRAVSILCCGQEKMHIEFCVRTLCELVLNEKAYLHPSITSFLDPYGIEVSKNALAATSANFGKV